MGFSNSSNVSAGQNVTIDLSATGGSDGPPTDANIVFLTPGTLTLLGSSGGNDYEINGNVLTIDDGTSLTLYGVSEVILLGGDNPDAVNTYTIGSPTPGLFLAIDAGTGTSYFSLSGISGNNIWVAPGPSDVYPAAGLEINWNGGCITLNNMTNDNPAYLQLVGDNNTLTVDMDSLTPVFWYISASGSNNTLDATGDITTLGDTDFPYIYDANGSGVTYSGFSTVQEVS